jgi:hypothetical protein
MLLAALVSALLQSTPGLGVPAPACQPAHPILAGKAPGAPGYGLQITTNTGKVLMTNLSFDPATHKPLARLYGIHGPAGWGPYRSGLELCLTHEPARPNPGDKVLHYTFYMDHFAISAPPKGSPADKAGLEGYNKSPFVRIDGVDGSNFGWDANALVYHITQNPTVVVETIKLPLFFGPSYRKYTLQNRKIDTPPDPADAELGKVTPNGEVKALLADRRTWADLLILRSRKPAFAPLPLDLAGRKVWAVLAQGQPSEDKPPQVHRSLEFWKEDPLTGAFEAGLLEVWPEPADGFQAGRALRIADHWYRFQAITQDPTTGQITTLNLRPWEADIHTLLEGRTLAKELGPQRDSAHQESLEQVANDALLEWKTLTLPSELNSQDLKSAGSFVVRLEKGVLALDLEVKGIRSRLDIAARNETERKAQAELAAKNGQPVPQVQATPARESERLADLLEQRKAILMAILGSAKQSLSNLRR